MTPVSRETTDRLRLLEDLVRAWTPRINLVSRASIDEIRNRHIADSLQVSDVVASPARWCDIGSGGGFPGLVIAICHEDTAVTLIESDHRKSVFLRHAANRLGVQVTIVTGRIEQVQPCAADIVSARALAPLDRLIPLARRHAGPNARFVFPKGARYRDEIAAARRHWSFEIDVRPSRTDKEAVILILENLERV